MLLKSNSSSDETYATLKDSSTASMSRELTALTATSLKPYVSKCEKAMGTLRSSGAPSTST